MNRQHFASHASRPSTAGARRPLAWLWVLLVWTLLAGPSSALAGSAPPRFEGKVEADVSLKVDRHGWRRNTAVVVFAVDGDRWSMTDDGGERFGGRVSRGHKKNRYELELDSHSRSRLAASLRRAVEDERREHVEIDLEKVKIALKVSGHQLKFKMKVGFEIETDREEVDGRAKVKFKARRTGGHGDRGTCRSPVVSRHGDFQIEACVDRLAFRRGEPVHFSYRVSNLGHHHRRFSFRTSEQFRMTVTDDFGRAVYPGTVIVSPAFTYLDLAPGHTRSFGATWNQHHGRGVAPGGPVPSGRYRLSGELVGQAHTRSEPIAVEIRR